MRAARVDRSDGWSGRWPRWMRVAVVIVLAGGLLSACTSASSNSSESAPKDLSTVGVCDATSVANRVLPSVVTITASNGTDVSTGSGEIIRPEGHIVTNNHVVSLAANGGTVS